MIFNEYESDSMDRLQERIVDISNSFYEPSLYEDIKSSTNIVTGDEYKETMIGIAKVASDMVKKTLGPYGSTTIIDDGNGFSYPTKDGWSTLTKLRFNDPLYNTLYNMIKQVSFNSVTSVGDGTTTAMVAASFFIECMYEFMKDNSFRQADFLDVIEDIYKEIETRMRNSKNIMYVNPDGNLQEIYNIAYTATNGNEKISSLIQNIYQETNNPNIHVDISSGSDIVSEIQEGYKLEAWTMNFKVYINTDNETCEKIAPTSVVIFDHNVTYNEHKDIITGLSTLANMKNTDILIIAPFFDDMITTLLSSRIQAMYNNGQVPNIILMKIPLTMNYHKNAIKDLSVITNCSVFDSARLRAFQILHHNQTHDEEDQIKDELLEDTLKEFNFVNPQDILAASLGKANKLVISKDNVLFQNYIDTVDKNLYNILIEEATANLMELKKKVNKTLNGTLDKDYRDAKMRHTNLQGKLGVIHVGGISDIQRKCDKDSVDDAVLVCKSAYENGYVRGFNLEILTVLRNMISEIEDLGNDDINTINYKLVILRALYESFTSVCKEAYRNKHGSSSNATVVNCRDKSHTLDLYGIIEYCLDNVSGYNMVTEEFNTLNELKVISSVSNDLEIVKAVINILTLIITSNQFISITKNYDRNANHLYQLMKLKGDKKELARSTAEGVLEAIKLDSLTLKDVFSVLLNR